MVQPMTRRANAATGSSKASDGTPTAITAPSVAIGRNGNAPSSSSAAAASAPVEWSIETVVHGSPETIRKRRLLGHEIQCLMHAFGEVRCCARESLEIVEDVIRDGVRLFAMEVGEQFDGRVTGVTVAQRFRTDTRALRRLGKMLELSARNYASNEMQTAASTVQAMIAEEEFERQERMIRDAGVLSSDVSLEEAQETLLMGPSWIVRLIDALPNVQCVPVESEQGEDAPENRAHADRKHPSDSLHVTRSSEAPFKDEMTSNGDTQVQVHSPHDAPWNGHEISLESPLKRHKGPAYLEGDVLAVDDARVLIKTITSSSTESLRKRHRPSYHQSEDPTFMSMFRADYILKQCMPWAQYADFVECRNMRYTHGESRSRPLNQRADLFREWINFPDAKALAITDDGLHALGHVAWEMTGLVTQSALLLRHYDDVAHGHVDCRSLCWSSARHLLAALGNGVATAIILPMTSEEYMAIRRELESFELAASPGHVAWRGLSDHGTQCLEPWQIREAVRRLRRAQSGGHVLARYLAGLEFHTNHGSYC